MESKEYSIIVSMLTQINQSISVLSNNQELMVEQYKILDKKIDNVEMKLTQKIDDVEMKLTKRIDDVEKKFDAKFDELDKKIDNVEIKLTQKIDDVEMKLTKRIDDVEKKFDAKFDELDKAVKYNSTNIIKLMTTVTKIEKDIVSLRDDINTIYMLEQDSRKKMNIKRLF